MKYSKSWAYTILIVLGAVFSMIIPNVNAPSAHVILLIIGYGIIPLVLFVILIMDRQARWWQKFLWCFGLIVVLTTTEYFGLHIAGKTRMIVDGRVLDIGSYRAEYPFFAMIHGVVTIVFGTLLFGLFRAKHPTAHE